MHILNLNVGQMEYIIIAVKKGLRDILKSIISATNRLYLFCFKVYVYKRFVNIVSWQYALTSVDLLYLDKDISKMVKKGSERPISTLSELRPKDEVVTSYKERGVY